MTSTQTNKNIEDLKNLKTYKIGTRGSLLALTQARFIKRSLEKIDPTTQFEIITIKTQGDQIVDRPLWQLEGKDFFTKELDQNLLSKNVDLVVHSYKDLGGERPEGINLGAVTKRAFANDILFIRKEIKAQLLNAIQSGNAFPEHFIVGTSAPRRIWNLERHLHQFIPGLEEGRVKTKVLRGNVNGRIKKLIDGNYHAIVLALAGMCRLVYDQEGVSELSALLQKVDFCILPLSHFPSAASQGALAIEYRKSINDEDNGTLQTLLGKIHHEITANAVAKEREIFQSFGGGCHLAVGINCGPTVPPVLSIKGEHQGRIINKIETLSTYPTIKNQFHPKAFLGMPKESSAEGLGEKETHFIHDELTQFKPLLFDTIVPKLQHATLRTPSCLPISFVIASKRSAQEDKLLSTIVGEYSGELLASGPKTMKYLVKKGYWVHACSDYAGEQELKTLTNHPVWQMLHGLLPNELPEHSFHAVVLTNEQSQSKFFPTVGTYSRSFTFGTSDYLNNLKQCFYFYWSSFAQYEHYTRLLPELKARNHFCGLGKTRDEFMAKAIDATFISGPLEFRHWFNTNINS